MCGAGEVQAKLRKQVCTESGPLDSSLSVPVGHNCCCSRGAAAVSPGRLRQPAPSSIHSIMLHTTTIGCSIRAGCPTRPTRVPPRDGTAKQTQQGFYPLILGGVLGVPCKYVPIARTGERALAHTRNRCAQWVGQVGHPCVWLLNRPNNSLYRVVQCPTPGWDRVGHPGTFTVGWSA